MVPTDMTATRQSRVLGRKGWRVGGGGAPVASSHTLRSLDALKRPSPYNMERTLTSFSYALHRDRRAVTLSCRLSYQAQCAEKSNTNRDGEAARILRRGIKTDDGAEAASDVRNPVCKEQQTENPATKHARRTPDVRNAEKERMAVRTARPGKGCPMKRQSETYRRHPQEQPVLPAGA